MRHKLAAEPYSPQISENWPRTIRATVPQLDLSLREMSDIEANYPNMDIVFWSKLKSYDAMARLYIARFSGCTCSS